MFWWIVGIVIVVAVLWGLYKYFTAGNDEYEESEIMVPTPKYDDPLLEDMFGDTVVANEQSKIDTRAQQHENDENFPTKIYDSQGNLLFGHQDETDDLDRPCNECVDCGCDPCECDTEIGAEDYLA